MERRTSSTNADIAPSRIAGRVASFLPSGVGLAPSEFERRHALLRSVLWLHLPALYVFGVARGTGLTHSLADVAPVAVLLAAERAARSASWRSFWVTAGLVWSSTALVHLADGQTEAHFHFFIVVGLIALYQRWVPFVWSIGFTVISHGIGSALVPGSMFNHSAAVSKPWLWATIHGVSVLAAAVAQVVFWSASEHEQRRIQQLSDELDVSARHDAEQRARFESLVANAFEGTAIIARDGQITWMSPAMARLTGLTVDDGLPTVLDPADRRRFERTIASLRHGERCEDLVVRSSEDRWLELSIVDLTGNDAVAGLVVNARDVSERREAERQLTWQANHDPLTGLPNRVAVTELLERRIMVSDQETALMFVDVDDFKSVNDRHGHAVGDEMLSRLADALRAVVRSSDTVARLGGDEFLIVCTLGSDVDVVQEIAQRVSEAGSLTIDVDGQRVSTTISVGLAFQEEGTSADELLRRADTAMYRAKDQGRDRIEVFDPSLDTDAPDLVHELRAALDNDEIDVHYQPIVSIREQTTEGLEALARWTHPALGSIPPVQFIPCAEEHGLIVDLGTQVLRRACRDLVAWDPDGSTYMSVNVSGLQLQRSSFASVVEGVLDETGLPASRLTIEVTESVVIDQDVVVRTNLDRLTAAGVRLAMDDFGTGYSALVNLKRFAFDVVKIDRDFVAGLGTRSSDEAIINAVVGMAHALGMSVTAEGIEHAEQLDKLAEIGSDCAQGYALGRPAPIDQVPRSASSERRIAAHV